MTYNLQSTFDPEQHAKTFVNYLEVIIKPDGTIEYAVPSHTKKLESIFAELVGASEESVMRMCPEARWFDYLEWLTEMTGCISVWNDNYVGNPNRKQQYALVSLRTHGLYKGKVK